MSVKQLAYLTLLLLQLCAIRTEAFRPNNFRGNGAAIPRRSVGDRYQRPFYNDFQQPPPRRPQIEPINNLYKVPSAPNDQNIGLFPLNPIPNFDSDYPDDIAENYRPEENVRLDDGELIPTNVDFYDREKVIDSIPEIIDRFPDDVDFSQIHHQPIIEESKPHHNNQPLHAQSQSHIDSKLPHAPQHFQTSPNKDNQKPQLQQDIPIEGFHPQPYQEPQIHSEPEIHSKPQIHFQQDGRQQEIHSQPHQLQSNPQSDEEIQQHTDSEEETQLQSDPQSNSQLEQTELEQKSHPEPEPEPQINQSLDVLELQEQSQPNSSSILPLQDQQLNTEPKQLQEPQTQIILNSEGANSNFVTHKPEMTEPSQTNNEDNIIDNYPSSTSPGITIYPQLYEQPSIIVTTKNVYKQENQQNARPQEFDNSNHNRFHEEELKARFKDNEPFQKDYTDYNKNKDYNSNLKEDLTNNFEENQNYGSFDEYDYSPDEYLRGDHSTIDLQVKPNYQSQSQSPPPQSQSQNRPVSQKDNSRITPQRPYNRQNEDQLKTEKRNYNDGEGEEDDQEEEEEPGRLEILLRESKFICSDKKDGYYADEQLLCEVFHFCQDGVKHSWLCPNGASFHQVHLICMPRSEDNICEKSSQFHFVNDFLYKEVSTNKSDDSKSYADRYYPADFTDGIAKIVNEGPNLSKIPQRPVEGVFSDGTRHQYEQVVHGHREPSQPFIVQHQNFDQRFRT